MQTDKTIALKIIKENEIINEPVALTVGSFDGVHKGHKFLIKQLKKEAKKADLKSAVMTFEPHPKIFFSPKSQFKLLNTLDEKENLLDKTGIDYLIVQKFNENFAKQSPENFIEKLKKQYGLQKLLMGYDHHFGKNRVGDFKYIQSLEKNFGFTTQKIDEFNENNENISSSVIKELLSKGEIEKANQFLGYPYFISGKVVNGNRIGNKLGFPTANIQVNSPYKLIPMQGVYVVKTTIDHQPYYGMMNIGIRPTINGKKIIKEVHFFNFDQDIYGKNLKIYFLKRLRDEQKFASLDDLKKQLQKDKENSLSYIKEQIS